MIHVAEIAAVAFSVWGLLTIQTPRQGRDRVARILADAERRAAQDD